MSNHTSDAWCDISHCEWAIDDLRKHVPNMDSHHAAKLYELAEELRELAARAAKGIAA